MLYYYTLVGAITFPVSIKVIKSCIYCASLYILKRDENIKIKQQLETLYSTVGFPYLHIIVFISF